MTPLTLEDIQDLFPIGTKVNVKARPSDSFKNYTGFVIKHEDDCFLVKDELTNDAEYTDYEQLSYCSDDHNL